MTRQRLWWAAGVVLALVVGAGVWFAVDGEDEPTECEATLGARDELLAEPLTSGDSTVGVLGDSYAQGVGLFGPVSGWPAILGERTGAEVVVDGMGGTGFTTRGYCTEAEVAYGERLGEEVRDNPVVIVQGGVNDALSGRPDEVAAAAEDLLEDLENVPTVVVVGPPAVPAADPADIRAVDAALRQATEDAGRVYVPLIDAGIELQPDQVHPTGPGQQRIAELVATAMGTAGRPG